MNARLTQAIESLIHDNSRHQVYRVASDLDPADPGRIRMVVTFSKGKRYCCTEPGCNFGIPLTGFWPRFRVTLQRAGINPPKPIRVSLTVVVEKGALIECAPKFCLPLESPGQSYEHEYRENEPSKLVQKDPPNGFTGQWVWSLPGGPRYEVEYVEGVPNGPSRTIHTNGSVLREGFLKDGQWHGTLITRNAKGEVLDSSEFVDGTGVYRMFYSSGGLHMESELRHGRRHGLTRRWNSRGELVRVEHWRDGVLTNAEGEARD